MKKKGAIKFDDGQLSQLLHAKLELEDVLKEIEERQIIAQYRPVPLTIVGEVYKLVEVKTRFEEICKILEEQNLPELESVLG